MLLKLEIGKTYVDGLGFSHLIDAEIPTSNDFGVYQELSSYFYRSNIWDYYLPNGERVYNHSNSKLNLIKEVTVSTYTVYCLWDNQIFKHKVNACSRQEVLLLASSKCIDTNLIIRITKS